MKEQSIETIIFDFGGVVIDIDPQITVKKLQELGFEDVSKFQSSEFIDDIVRKFERGIFTPEVFRERIRAFLGMDITDQQLDDAWNALIYDIPAERIEILEQVKENYKMLLLSNSNEIHYDLYVRDLQLRFGYREFDELFHKAYFSFDTHLSKPDSEAYEFIMYQHDLNPAKTLFIDDNEENIKTAKRLGLKTYLLKKPQRIRDIFKNGRLKPDLKIS
ncbi:MAG: HAD family phosphatase [Bacteroidetes bacterium]|nr:MAG: HAD family phosphatase [Bacteroidota bacterium]RLD49492.1 MAG: HAD family phosphatase [Bacteroidota bacterium]RLD74619.1 MAG: HAD family phosphatase [Bacteroidota bacterium]RLD89169.1 MAG: HAD family phosphatase [Bacteroidota bacterium]